jgi:guanylate kinase
MSNRTGHGRLFVVSAPSGTGKTTIVERLLERCPGLVRSRSFTSRAARVGETDGVDYNFVSRPIFEEMARNEQFLEWADIFGNLYGTGRKQTADALATGSDVVLVIDVQGARQVRERIPDTVGVFVLPPSFSVLAARLRGRNKDPESAIQRRLQTAADEVLAVDEYDYVLVNADLDQCVEELEAIVRAERVRRERRRDEISLILRSFRSS